MTNTSSTKPTPGQPTLSWKAKLLLLAFSGTICLAILELGLRVIVASAPEPVSIDFVADPKLRDLPKIAGMVAMQTANQNATFKGHYFRTNSDGIRGPEYEIPKPADVFRTLIVGDSFTMGSGVAEGDTYSAQLQDLLNAEKGPYRQEVINLGVGGYNLQASVFRLRHLGLKYQPDMLVYGWTYNDIEGPAYRKTSKPRGQSRTGLVLESWLRERIDSIRDLVHPAADSYIAELDENYFNNDEAWQVFLGDLDNFASVAKEEGVCATVLLHAGMYSFHSWHPFQRFYDRVAEAAAERGLYVATSYERFEGLEPSELWIHPTDSHPNAKGHKILADALKASIDSLPAECRKPKFRAPPTPAKPAEPAPPTIKTMTMPGKTPQPGYTVLAHVEGHDVMWVDLQGNIVKRVPVEMPAGYVEVLDDGKMLNLTRGRLQELDGQGKLLWEYSVPNAHVHHDSIPSGHGTFYVIIQRVNRHLVLWNDEIQEVDRNKRVLWKWNALDHLKPSDGLPCGYNHRWSEKTDWLHTNSLDIFPNGDLLVSLRNLNRIVRISRESGEIIWSWGEGILGHQHSVKFTDQGNILIFDNGFHRIKGRDCDGVCRSRAIEMNPETGEIVWQFSEAPLFAQGFGDVDRLANGNTLITYGQNCPNAQLVEVDPDGEVVWTLETTYRTKALGVERSLLYRSQRVSSVGSANP